VDGGAWRSVRLEEVCPLPSPFLQSDLPLATIARRIRRHRVDAAIIENADWIIMQAKAIADRRGARFEVLFLTDMAECVSGSFTVDIDRLRTPFSTLMENCPAADEAVTFTFPGDAHLNVEGNRWLAQAILDFLNHKVLGDAPRQEAVQPAR
jgi:hypothetical protein